MEIWTQQLLASNFMRLATYDGLNLIEIGQSKFGFGRAFFFTVHTGIPT